MRQLAALPNADAAQTLADYLQTLRIETHLERLPDGCAVWVLDEDRLPQARKALDDFTQNPADPRFASARRTAEAMRRRLEKEEEERAAGAAPIRPEPPATGLPGPWTRGLIGVCVLVFVMDAGYVFTHNLSQGPLTALGYALHLAPDAKVPPSPVEQALAFSSYEMKLTVNGKEVILPWPRQILSGQVWRLATPIFLHFGLIHLLFNMVFLYQLGGMIEARRGPWRYLLLGLVCAVLSNIAQYGLSTIGWEDGRFVVQMPGLFGGMSGVLYGLFGYIWMKSRYEPALGLALSRSLVIWMIVWLFVCWTGVIGSVANFAHVAGLIVGVVIGAAPHLWRQVRGARPT